MDDVQHQFENWILQHLKTSFHHLQVGVTMLPVFFQLPSRIALSSSTRSMSDRSAPKPQTDLSNSSRWTWWLDDETDFGTQISLFFLKNEVQNIQVAQVTKKKGGLKTQPSDFSPLEGWINRRDQGPSRLECLWQRSRKNICWWRFWLFLLGIPTWAVVVVVFFSTWNLDIYIYAYLYIHIDMGLSLYMYGCMHTGTYHHGINVYNV